MAARRLAAWFAFNRPFNQSRRTPTRTRTSVSRILVEGKASDKTAREGTKDSVEITEPNREPTVVVLPTKITTSGGSSSTTR